MGFASDELLAQLVGVVLLVGFVGAYFWWIFAALAAVAAGVLRPPVVAGPPSARRPEHAAIAARADQEQAWVLAGGARGVVSEMARRYAGHR
jgi:hypothetical protein